MEIFARLLYLGFALVSNMFFRLEGFISKREKGRNERDPHQKWLQLGTTWKSAAVDSLKHHLNNTFLLKLITCVRFPFQEQNIGNWFQEDIQINGEHRQINILNLTRKPASINQYPPINGTDFITNITEDGYQVLYHGTTHDSALNIIRDRINLNKLCSRKQDFSCGKGFYLTDKFDDGSNSSAVGWAFHRSHEKQAVLIFKIPNDEMDRYGRNSRSFSNDEELIEFVRRCREGLPSLGQLESDLENVSFVKGHWVNREYKVVHRESHQICLHDEELAKCFDRHLHSAIFFNRNLVP